MQRTQNVLLVDDNNLIVAAYQNLLKINGFGVLVATDGEAAIELALGEKPDLVLLDLQLPKRSGLEVLQTLRAAPDLKAVPVIVFTQSYMPGLTQGA